MVPKLGKIRNKIWQSLCTTLLAVLGGWVPLPALPPPASTQDGCLETSARLCLLGRFAVEATWWDAGGLERVALAVPLPSSGSGAFAFFGREDADLLVRLVEERPGSGRFAVEAGAASGAPFELRVLDTRTGAEWTHRGPRGWTAALRADFGPTGPAVDDETPDAAELQAATVDRRIAEFLDSAGSVGAAAEAFLAGADCRASANDLCLLGGRLKVDAKFGGAGKPGKAWALAGSGDTGLFSAGESGAAEVAVRVVDGRAVNGHFWLLYSAISDAKVEIEVVDLASGNRRRFVKPAGLLASAADVEALSEAAAAVSVTLDRTRSVSALVPASGGTVTAVSANGTVFTLQIPPKALLSPQKIVMTPVQAMKGLPFKPGFVAAVHLEPAGLQLFEFANLTIKPRVAVPRSQETTFSYRGTGQEFFLYPPDLGNGLAMKFLRFGGYGVAKGTVAQQSAQQKRLPTRAEDRFMQKLQELVAKRRRAKLAEGSEAAPTLQDFYDLAESIYARDIKPKLPILRSKCEEGKAIANLALTWAREVQLLGLVGFEDEQAEIMDAIVDGLVNCYDEAHRKCVDRNDPAQVIAMLGHLRQLHLLGVGDRVDESKIEKCVRFELQFESVVDQTQGDTNVCDLHQHHHHVRARVPIRTDDLLVFRGSAALNYVDSLGTGACGTDPRCTISVVGRQNDTISVEKLDIDFNLVEGGRSTTPVITMTYAPGQPLSDEKQVCPGGASTDSSVPRFGPAYALLHSQDIAGTIPGGGATPNLLFFARDWKFLGSASTWAERSYRQTFRFASITISEDTLLLLRHTPE